MLRTTSGASAGGSGLIDGADLTRLMYDYGIGVRSGRSLAVKRVDDAYFDGEI